LAFLLVFNITFRKVSVDDHTHTIHCITCGTDNVINIPHKSPHPLLIIWIGKIQMSPFNPKSSFNRACCYMTLTFSDWTELRFLLQFI
jgi:hypothetical protein